MTLLSKWVPCPPSWFAQEMLLALCFPRSAGSSAPRRPTPGRCTTQASPLQLPFPRRTGLSFVTAERRGDEKLVGEMCQAWREPSTGAEGGRGRLAHKDPSCPHTCGAAGALTGE